jgi:peroxidase
MATRGVMVALLLAAVAASCATAQLHEKFYSESCPSVEDVVRKELVRALSLAPSLAAPLLRMHFHDCFVRVRLHSFSRCALNFCVQVRES